MLEKHGVNVSLVERMTFEEFQEKIKGTSLEQLDQYFMVSWHRYMDMFLPVHDPYELYRRRFIFLTKIEDSFQSIFYDNEKFRDAIKSIEKFFVNLN